MHYPYLQVGGSGAWHDTANSYKVIKGVNSVMGAEGRFVSRLVVTKTRDSDGIFRPVPAAKTQDETHTEAAISG